MMLATGGTVHDRYHCWDLLAGIGVSHRLEIPFDQFSGDPFGRLQHFVNKHNKWCFFHMTYDQKNAVERLTSGNYDRIGFPELVAFVPQAVIGVKENQLYGIGDQKVIASISSGTAPAPTALSPTTITPRITRRQYLEAVKAIKRHIRLGDIYELNYCQEFFGTLSGDFSSEALWHRLFHAAQAPFSAYYRWGHHLLCSASPERFLQRRGDLLISQPMKGTIRRGALPGEDQMLKEKLLADLKERAENVMIVDLVRNDLSRVASRGSVKVEELFGIYTFATVHQMISTITAELEAGRDLSDILRATFPMGSMTGAPKIRAMELAEQYELSRRGLFSGCVGYITPDGDFDMNVIIRSIICDLREQVCSLQAGGAITEASVPEEEYDESMLKGAALIRALNGKLKTS